eukprot:4115335-Prymnesium_polylepis.2
MVPPQVEIRLGILLPMFGTKAAGYSPMASWSPRVGAYQAVREINSKADGIADNLLPNQQLLIAYRDDKCDATEGLAGALSLTRDAFAQGVDAIVGAGCSSASLHAAQVAAIEQIPIVSPSSFSPALSDGRAYPFFLRVGPSDAYVATALVDVLMRMFNYTSVAVVSSSDTYGVGAASAFQEESERAGLMLSAKVHFPTNAIDLSQEVATLL